MSDDDDLWQALKRFTPARLGLGRHGASLPTRALLDFDVAHALARDAVHAAVDWDRLEEDLRQCGATDMARVESAAADRATYLRRPDLGRRLHSESVSRVQALAQLGVRPPDVVWVLGDGLSAAALQLHAAPLVAAMADYLKGLRVAPLILARHARVALGDEIGALFDAEFVIVVLGERPGLSSPDSLGVYLTHRPHIGRRDAERNCLSNIRQAGLSYGVAARKLSALMQGARRLGATGTALKDETDAEGLLLAAPSSKSQRPDAIV